LHEPDAVVVIGAAVVVVVEGFEPEDLHWPDSSPRAAKAILLSVITFTLFEIPLTPSGVPVGG